jgi:hypothetical protein
VTLAGFSTKSGIQTGPTRPPKVYDCARNTHPWEYIGHDYATGADVYRCPKCGLVSTD